jgi:hypothetical protein
MKQRGVLAHEVEDVVGASLDLHRVPAHWVEAVEGLASVDDVELEQGCGWLRSPLCGGRFDESQLCETIDGVHQGLHVASHDSVNSCPEGRIIFTCFAVAGQCPRLLTVRDQSANPDAVPGVSTGADLIDGT